MPEQTKEIPVRPHNDAHGQYRAQQSGAGHCSNSGSSRSLLPELVGSVALRGLGAFSWRGRGGAGQATKYNSVYPYMVESQAPLGIL